MRHLTDARRRPAPTPAWRRPTVLVIPGLGGSTPGHWQSRWEARHPDFRRVEQSHWDVPRRIPWVVRLEAAVRAALPERVVLVAQSLGCPLVAHWARHGSVQRVVAALLVAPADVEREGALKSLRDFAPLPLDRLPFPSWVVASSNDPYASLERARHFARAWGSRFLEAGARGHLNEASGHGDWPEGEALLDGIVHGITARRTG